MSLRLFIYTISLILLLSCDKKPEPIYTIAYASKELDVAGIFLTNEEAKTKMRLISHPENVGYLAWSPDGKRIAFYAYHDGRKTWSIYTVNSDGSNKKRLTHVKNKWDSSPAWSPDGNKIVFGRAYTDPNGVRHEEIWIMNSDGSEQTQIQSLNGGGAYFAQNGRILYHSKINTNKSEICIADIDGNNIVKLTNNDAEDWHPEVSPNGQQVVFMSDRDGNKEIYVMNIDGSGQNRITFNDNNFEPWYPSWSPDGSKIVFSSYEESGEKNIYVMNNDGSSVKKIISNGSNPSWLKVKD